MVLRSWTALCWCGHALRGGVSWLAASEAVNTGWQGAFAAGSMLLGAHFWQSLVGNSNAVCVASGAAILLGAVGAWLRLPERTLGWLSDASRNFALCLLLAAWLVLAPTWVEFCAQTLSHAGLGVNSPNRNALVIGLLAIVTQGLPTMLALSVVRVPRKSNETAENAPLAAASCFGAACGIVVLLVLCTWLGDFFSGVLLGVCGVAIAFRTWWISLEGLASQPATLATSATAQSIKSRGPMFPLLLDATLCALLGAMVACEGWVARQLSISSVPAHWGEIFALCLGLGAGLWRARRARGTHPAGTAAHVVFAVGIAAACAALLLAGFGTLIQTSLWLSSHVQSSVLLIALRTVAYGWPLAAAAYAAGMVLGTARSPASSETGSPVDWRLLMLGSGWWLGLHAPVHAVNDVGGWLLVAAAVALIVTLLRPGLATGSVARVQTAAILETLANLRSGRWRRLSAAALITALVVAPCFRLQYDPAWSARVLFTSNAFVAYRNGFESNLLTSLDDARLVASRQGEFGTLTVWKSSGFRHQIRENGVPRGIVSTDPLQLPHYTAEVLQTVYPLVLHDKPQSLLVLGAGSGVSLSTSLEFPLKRCVCAEGDVGMRELVLSDLKRLAGSSVLEDERVELWRAVPLQATVAARETFDVIVSNPGHPALVSTLPYLTSQFYHSAADKLTADGIFSQRWEGIDLGPVPIQTIGRHMRSAFRDVMVVEIAAGELLFLATNAEQGLIREKLYDRCQADQVRRTLAHIGFDWSMLLDLPACGSEEMEEFCQPASRLAELMESGRLACSLPVEVMRWAPKQQEIQAALEPHRGRFLNWLGEDSGDPLLLRRFNEVASQTKLKSTYSTQYWAYRASVREQVSAHPKTLIQRTSGGPAAQGLDMEDRRRLAYFSTLSRTIKSQQTGDVQKLLSFAAPYDPLLTDFVYLEAAELAKKAQPRDLELELRCRLHSVYFASPADTSVRTVAQTLRLLRDHPEAEANPRQRWDLTNSMLQTLQARWSARTGVPAQSTTRQVLLDIDETLKNANLSMKEMVALTAEAGYPPSMWTTRRQVLERTLIAPVEVYKTQVARYHREIELKDE